MPPTFTAEAIPVSPSNGDAQGTFSSRVVTTPEGAKEGDVLIIDGREVIVPPGVRPGESFIVGEEAPVVATPVRDEEFGAPVLIDEGHTHLTLHEQKLLNCKSSMRCVATVDALSTIILTAAGSWGILAAIFVVGPILGFCGARYLQLRKITAYFAFSIFKTINVVVFVILGSYLAIFVLIVQLWVTQFLSKFWRLLASTPPERLAQLSAL